MTSNRDDDSPLDLSPWAAPTPPRGLTSRVMDAVRASADTTADVMLDETGARTPRHPHDRPRWRGVAIGLTAGAAAAAILWAAWPRPRTNGPASGHVVAGAPSKITLGGGTVALLAAGADVTWERTPSGLAVTQSAGNVTYQHPGPSSLVITTPLAEVHTAGASLNVEVPMSSSKSKVVIAGAAGAGIAAAVVVAVYEGRAEVREPATSPRVVEAGGQVALAAPGPSRSTYTPVAKATKDRAQRDALAAAIAQARAARTSAATGGASGGPMPAGTALTTGPGPAAKVDLTPGELSKEEIRDGVREVIPLLSECYQLMLDKHPRMGGRVVAKLVVDAEPDVGTIVTMQDDSEVQMKGTTDGADPRELQNDFADFRQCLTATLETVALPPLGDKDGGRVEITYPFVFAPSEEEADQYDNSPTPPPGPAQKQTEATAPADHTTEEMVTAAENAARQSQWARASKLAQQVLAKRGIPSATRKRAALVYALAGCNLGDVRMAKAGYDRMAPAGKVLVRQRCLSNGIELEGDAADNIKDPFGRMAPPPPPSTDRNDDGNEVLDPFKRR